MYFEGFGDDVLIKEEIFEPDVAYILISSFQQDICRWKFTGKNTGYNQYRVDEPALPICTDSISKTLIHTVISQSTTRKSITSPHERYKTSSYTVSILVWENFIEEGYFLHSHVFYARKDDGEEGGKGLAGVISRGVSAPRLR